MKKYSIFVYGSLMHDQVSSHFMDTSEFVGSFVLKDYGMYRIKWYPGIIYEENECVYGEVYYVNQETLEKLNRYEGSEYALKEVTVSNDTVTMDAYVYVYLEPVEGEPIRERWNG